ncbi:MAG: zinc ribbon domain-containing protein [archaeon]|nr:zinc ribbon domain-containing protein [archaeon]
MRESTEGTTGAEGMRFCMECGEQVDPDAEFCYQCGSRRVIDVDPANNRIRLEPGEGPYCGTRNLPEDRFCASCGKRIGTFEYVPQRSRRLTTREKLIVFISIVPAAFNLFGIGHILLGRYSRALMYLVMSAVLIYIRWFCGPLEMSTLIFIEVIGLVIFMKQSFEVINLIQSGPRGGS